MKVTVNFEFTPEEARKFLGLPDTQPLQDAMMKEVEQRMSFGMQGVEQIQKMFWSQIQQNMTNVANMTGGIAVFGERKAVK